MTATESVCRCRLPASRPGDPAWATTPWPRIPGDLDDDRTGPGPLALLLSGYAPSTSWRSRAPKKTLQLRAPGDGARRDPVSDSLLLSRTRVQSPAPFCRTTAQTELQLADSLNARPRGRRAFEVGGTPIAPRLLAYLKQEPPGYVQPFAPRHRSPPPDPNEPGVVPHAERLSSSARVAAASSARTDGWGCSGGATGGSRSDVDADLGGSALPGGDLGAEPRRHQRGFGLHVGSGRRLEVGECAAGLRNFSQMGGRRRRGLRTKSKTTSTAPAAVTYGPGDALFPPVRNSSFEPSMPPG